MANAMTTGVVEETGNATAAGDSRACSNRENREDKCGDIIPSIEGGGCSKKSLYNRGR